MVLRYTYEIKDFIVDKDSVNDFVFVINKRKQRNSAVNRLKRSLEDGCHFESPIVVNKNDKLQIIDGNHRIAAVQGFLSENPNEKIVVLLAVYQGLNEDEKNEVFTIWNSGTRQTKDDFVMNRKDDIPLLKWVDEDFPWPVSIYKDRDQLHFFRLISAYLAAKNSKPAYQASNESFVKDTISLTKADYDFLKGFVAGFRTHFGDPTKDNLYANTTPFLTLMNLYYNNKDKIQEPKLWRVLTKMKANNQANQLCTHGGRTASSTLIRLLENITGLRSNVPIEAEEIETA